MTVPPIPNDSELLLRCGEMTADQMQHVKAGYQLASGLADKWKPTKAALKIKPLEWVTPSPTTDGQWQDTTGMYDIEESILFIGHVETGIRFKSDRAAKAAAQEHHEKRVMAAIELIETPPAPPEENE